jgi:hypothetical protein
MVRINLIAPVYLADQHLIAEYDEILMLFGYARKYRELNGIPERYTLGKGHIRFFKNKLLYLKHRHELISKEMVKRGVSPKVKADITEFSKEMHNDYFPDNEAVEIIKERLIIKLKLKKGYYRYYRELKQQEFFISMIEKATI